MAKSRVRTNRKAVSKTTLTNKTNQKQVIVYTKDGQLTSITLLSNGTVGLDMKKSVAKKLFSNYRNIIKLS